MTATGKHAEMLAWTKSLIKLRRCTVALNDGNMHHLMVSSDDKRMTLVMQREEARILVNLGMEPQHFDLLDGECLCLISRLDTDIAANAIDLPGMTLAVLLSPTENVEDREVR